MKLNWKTLIVGFLVYLMYRKCMKCSENFTVEKGSLSIKWNTKAGFDDVSKLIFVRTVDGEKIEEKEVTSNLDFSSGVVSFTKTGKGTNVVSVYKDSVSEENFITKKEVSVGETSVIDVGAEPTGNPLNQVQGWQNQGVHVWNELNTNGQTKEKCIEHARQKGYPAWGFRNADHPDGRYKNTCWFYKAMDKGLTGATDDFVHITGCSAQGLKVSDGCKPPEQVLDITGGKAFYRTKHVWWTPTPINDYFDITLPTVNEIDVTVDAKDQGWGGNCSTIDVIIDDKRVFRIGARGWWGADPDGTSFRSKNFINVKSKKTGLNLTNPKKIKVVLNTYGGGCEMHIKNMSITLR